MSDVVALSCDKRCLSIQSHVVSGYVGNKCAVFPLQLHGFDVSFINSVQFSNHTKYKEGIKGQILNGDELRDIVQGLKNNNLLRFSHLLTGYIGSESFLQAVMGVVEDVRKENPEAIYVCDPVLGDDGRMYVPENLVAIYKAEVLSRATILTPNQFEAELLTDSKITDVKTALNACDTLHQKGVETVIITSTDLPAGQSESMLVIVSTPWSKVQNNLALWGDKKPDTPYARFTITIPKLENSFTGTGDLTAASILAWTQVHSTDYVTALEKVMATLQSVCQSTMDALPERKGPMNELQLVQCKRVIEDPRIPESLRATPLYS